MYARKSGAILYSSIFGEGRVRMGLGHMRGKSWNAWIDARERGRGGAKGVGERNIPGPVTETVIVEDWARNWHGS